METLLRFQIGTSRFLAALPISPKNAIIPNTLISQKIYFIRDTRMVFDGDLAQLYGVATKNLNKAVKRNASRFPSDFMFRLGKKAMECLTSQ